MLWTLKDLMKGNGLILKKARSRQYPTETIIDADDQVLLTSIQVESQLHSLEQVANGAGLYVKSDKTEFICFKQNRAISTLNVISRPFHIPW